ncbi:MAG: DUF4167 domain-containing protein [Sphingomicrobium sp.]
MINNRQGGRRRGRGGQRSPNVGGQPGNRQDNRQRGNAAQLLEKYKSMARDSQLAGDRVQTEYYLQYADHYFRVLGDNRPRSDEQRRPRDDDFDGDDGDDDMGDGDGEIAGDEPLERPERQPRNEPRAEPRPESRPEPRPETRNEPRAEQRNEPRAERGPRRPRAAARAEADGRPEREFADDSPRPNGGETIPFDVLPPAIGRDDAPADEQPRRPRRAPRARAASRSDDDDEAAPVV